MLQRLLRNLHINDDGFVLGNGDAACGTENFFASFVEVDAHFWIHDSCLGDNSQVIHERLASVTEVRGLHCNDLDGLADGVHNQGLQRLALDVFCDDQQRTVGLHNLLQQWEEVWEGRNLVANKQHCRVVQDSLLSVVVVDEIRGKVALVERNTFGDLESSLDGLGLLNGDDTVLANLFHRCSNDLADNFIAG